jgi:hypothetical protein
MENTLEKHGRLMLVKSKEGMRWELSTNHGVYWRWDPRARQWTCEGRWSQSREEASRGLEGILARSVPGNCRA